ARRHRHARGAGRADYLGAARAAPQADPARQHRRILGRPAQRVRAHEPQRLHPLRLAPQFPGNRGRRADRADAHRRRGQVDRGGDRRRAGGRPAHVAAGALRRLCDERDGFDTVAVRVADEGRIVALAMMRPQARRPVGRAACRQRRGVEPVDRRGGRGAQADVHAVVLRAGLGRQHEHLGPMIEPELRIALAEPDRRRPHLELAEAEARQHRLVKGRRPHEIAHRDGDVVDHRAASGSPHERSDMRGRKIPDFASLIRAAIFDYYPGAPDFTSLYTIESISAWNDASMMFGETPTVVQRSPLSSWLSISTRVIASVPPSRIRTRKSDNDRPSMYFWYLPRSLRSAWSSALTGPLPSAAEIVFWSPTFTLTTAMATVTRSPTAL